MPNYYVIVGMDTDTLDGGLVGAYSVAKERLHRRVWPIYKGTRNRNTLKVGDVCLLYLAGSGPYAQKFIAKMTIERVTPWTQRRPFDSNFLVKPERVIYLKDVSYITPPVSIRPILSHLNFIPKNLNKWGAVFQGGCRKIGEKDYRLITGEDAQKVRRGQTALKGRS